MGLFVYNVITIKDLYNVGPWDPANRLAEQAGVMLLEKFLKFNLTSHAEGKHPEWDYKGLFSSLPEITIEQKITSAFSPYLETRGLGNTRKGLTITEADYHLYIMPAGRGNIGKVRLYHTKDLWKIALIKTEQQQWNGQQKTQGAFGVRFHPLEDLRDKDFWVCDIATTQDDQGRVTGFDEEKVTKGFGYWKFLEWQKR